MAAAFFERTSMMKSEEEIRRRLMMARNVIANITDGKADSSASPYLAEFFGTATENERQELLQQLVRAAMGEEQLLEWVLGEEKPPLRCVLTRNGEWERAQ
jgi:hypothetical protein